MKQEKYDQDVKSVSTGDRKLQSSIPVCANCKNYREGEDCGKHNLDEFGDCSGFYYDHPEHDISCVYCKNWEKDSESCRFGKSQPDESCRSSNIRK